MAGLQHQAFERGVAEALARLTDGLPMLVDCRPAREALELADGTVLHAGPPIDTVRAGSGGAVAGGARALLKSSPPDRGGQRPT